MFLTLLWLVSELFISFSTDLYLQCCKIIAKDEAFRDYFFCAKIFCVTKRREIVKVDLCNEHLNLNFVACYIVSVRCSVRFNNSKFKNFICS